MTSGEGDIRQAIIEDDLVDCIVALPKQLFLTTQIPVCLWFLSKNKNDGKFRDRKGETLFIDARKFGYMVDRVHKAFTDEDIEEIASIYLSWKNKEGKYEDVKGFCKSVTIENIKKGNFILTPGRYVGIHEDLEMDVTNFQEKFSKLEIKYKKLKNISNELDNQISAMLEGLKFGS